MTYDIHPPLLRHFNLTTGLRQGGEAVHDDDEAGLAPLPQPHTMTGITMKKYDMFVLFCGAVW